MSPSDKLTFMKKVLKYSGFILGLASLFLFQIIGRFPHFVEETYTNFIYKLIRGIYGITLYYSPISIIYIFIFLVLFLIGKHIYRRMRRKNKIPSIAFILNLLGWLLVIFYWSWGFNYARQNFSSRIDLEISSPDPNFMYEELLKVDHNLGILRKEMRGVDTIPLRINLLHENYQDEIRESQAHVLEMLDEPHFSKVKIRTLVPKGILLRIKTAGVYLPFAIEGHIDGGLHHIEKPYVLAHEMAHANAFTDEGVCNFIGFLYMYK